jgi:hypothetical protein
MHAVIMDVILPEEPEWDSSQVLTGTWPILIIIEKWASGSFMVSGIVIRPYQNGSHKKIGTLLKSFVYLESESEDRLQLRSKYGGGTLECERRSIRLA